jgi:hypothetical protein
MSARTNKKSISPKPKKAVRELRANYQVRPRHSVTSRQNRIIKKCREALAAYCGNRLQSVKE